jgi:V8-like Glu-specific endopeptidase
VIRSWITGGEHRFEGTAMNPRAQTDAAAGRFRSTRAERTENERRQRTGATRLVATPDQIEARVARLATAGAVTPDVILRAIPGDEQVERTVLLERIIDETNDLQSVNFLSRGARAVRTVGRISSRSGGRALPIGTAFLVAPGLVLTNNHVLPSAADADAAVLELNCENDADNQPGTIVTYRLAPAELYLTDVALDYSLVAVSPGPDGRLPGSEFGWNRLVHQQGKIVVGESLNVVGHPQGRLKEVALRNNTLVNQLEHFLHYETDTEPGNSGSPVFNDQWEVVALHHSGIPRTDAKGNWLRADGTRWQPGDGDAAVHWIANEGVRVSVLLSHVFGRTLSATEAQLLSEMGPQAVPAGTLDAPATVVTTPIAMDGSATRAPARRRSPIEAVTHTGLPARGPAYADGTQVIFLHGRSQQGKDPMRLRAGWTAGLTAGLASAGLPPIDAADVWFPYYGDVLHAATVRESVTDPATSPVYEELLNEAAELAGMPPTRHDVDDRERWTDVLVSRLRRPLSWLADRSGLDEEIIASRLVDVAAYLDDPSVRDRVLAAVLECVPATGRAILVSHSLGTVVAMDLLTRLPAGLTVDTLITAGSPLGLDGVHKRLLVGGPRRPGVGTWLNAWCAADAVAIGCPLAPTWGDVVDVMTTNAKDRAHDIAEYLSDERVAGAVAGSHGNR